MSVLIRGCLLICSPWIWMDLVGLLPLIRLLGVWSVKHGLFLYNTVYSV